jgi:2-polyprenyl-3-methyl-5-hydroxy-6-metoxy-1,4-benzoquinol methylase
LSKAGYEVTLLDLSQANLAFAQAQAASEGVILSDAVHGNALDLRRFSNHAFDGVLLMGPLYHLLELDLRVRCATEVLRVVRPNGIVCASFITRFAAIRDAAVQRLYRSLRCASHRGGAVYDTGWVQPARIGGRAMFGRGSRANH